MPHWHRAAKKNFRNPRLAERSTLNPFNGVRAVSAEREPLMSSLIWSSVGVAVRVDDSDVLLEDRAISGHLP